MKTLYKNLIYLAAGAVLSLFLAFPVSAQRPASSVSAGGGSHSSGGGSVSSARPSGGGGSFGSRPSMGNSGLSRPSVNVRRTGFAPQRVSGQGYGNRPGIGYTPRPGIGYTSRQGISTGNYGYPARTGIAPGRVNYTTGYRTAPQIGYGRGGYWGDHGYYHNNQGYYNTYYSPRLGYTCGALPYGYYPFYWGDYQYFYSDGLFYQYDDDQYTVVEPPIGAQLTTLPDKAQSIVINGGQYYEEDGVYYQPVTKDDGTVVYEVVGKDGELTTAGAESQDQQPQGPQMGDVVNQLPPDCRKIKVSNQKLWVSPDGVYYQEQADANGNKSYKIVGLPSDGADQN